MIEETMDDAKTRMGKSVDAMKNELSRIRTGRAHPSILDHVTVDYYGSPVPVSQVGNISVEDARTLTIVPWEKPMIAAIEKAIMHSDLGLNPQSAGAVIRVPLPPLTEERRRDLVRVVRSEAEAGKVSVRNIRRDVLGDFKTMRKEKMISEDDERRADTAVQKLTDEFVAKIDAALTEKERELMEI